MVGSLLTASLAAYAFSRIPFRGRDSVFVVLLAALMVPTQLTIIPIFIIMRKLELIDTLAALWIPALVNVFAIFFLRQYFNTIPRDLDEAARIDGAGHLRILFQILLPLAGPALSALAILGFEASWNNYFGPLIFLNSPEKMTLPVGLVSLSAGQGGGPAVVVFAGITLVVLPILIVFLVFQRAVRGERRVGGDPRMTGDAPGRPAAAGAVRTWWTNLPLLLLASIPVSAGWVVLRSVAAGVGLGRSARHRSAGDCRCSPGSGVPAPGCSTTSTSACSS